MARISGVDLPRNKHVNIALTYTTESALASTRLLNGEVEPMKESPDLNEDEAIASARPLKRRRRGR